MSHHTPRDAAKHAVRGDLKPRAAEQFLDREGSCIQFLGIDSEDRAVYYCSDDGTVARYDVIREDGRVEMERDADAHKSIGYSLPDPSESVEPFAAAFTYLTTHGERWNWIHPRFRWIADELDAMDGEELET